MNIYTLSGEHIGKRSANGIWCWDCKVKTIIYNNFSFKCPACYKKLYKRDIKYNPMERELGFDKSKPRNKKGIDGASCFCWNTDIIYGLDTTIEEIKRKLKRVKFVKTEYKDKWTIKEFWNMFKDIIQEDTLGGYFS